MSADGLCYLSLHVKNILALQNVTLRKTDRPVGADV